MAIEYPDALRLEYYINADERGEFRADVRNADTGRTVYEFEGFWMFEDGFMAHAQDVDGLLEYMQWNSVVPADATITRGN